jgi:hypothetical protein
MNGHVVKNSGLKITRDRRSRESISLEIVSSKIEQAPRVAQTTHNVRL